MPFAMYSLLRGVETRRPPGVLLYMQFVRKESAACTLSAPHCLVYAVTSDSADGFDQPAIESDGARLRA